MERERGRKPSADVEAGPDGDALSLAQVEAVLRRAAQLDTQGRAPAASGLAAEEVTRIALEAGLSPEAVDAALRELELGTLTKEQKASLVDARVGPQVVRTARLVDLPPDAAAASLTRLLGEELLEPIERTGRRVVWGSQEGIRANLLRTVRRGWAGAGDFRKLELVSEVRAADQSGTRSIVSLEARLQGRGGRVASVLSLAGVTAFATLGLGAVGLAHLAHQVPDAMQFLTGSGMAAAAGGTVSALTASSIARRWRERVRRARASLDKILDGL